MHARFAQTNEYDDQVHSDPLNSCMVVISTRLFFNFFL